jgi:Xaa-Pro aminopeptidase
LKDYVAGRVRRCRQALRERELAGLVVTNPRDVTYLTGFQGDDSVLVLTAQSRVLVTDSRYTVQARRECPGLRLLDRKRLKMAEAVAAVLERNGKVGAGPIAVEADQITVSAQRSYRKHLGRRLQAVEPVVAPLRITKDDWELSRIRKAIRVAQTAMERLLPTVRAGETERELAARLDYEMARLGSTAVAFDSIVAVGAHGAEPHAIPGPAKVRANTPFLTDWGATVDGYRSDLTRCWAPGKIRPVFAEAYRWVLEAQTAAIARVRPGETLGAVDAAARAVMGRSGLPVYGHGTGHGIGLDIHEAPALKADDKTPLRQGMVVTIEPGVYLEGRFGIRIEDDVLVGSGGPVLLSSLPRGLEAVAI